MTPRATDEHNVHDEHDGHTRPQEATSDDVLPSDGITPGDEERATLSPGAGVSMHPATRQAVEEIKAKHQAADRAARAKREANPH